MKANTLIKNCIIYSLLPLTVLAFILAGKFSGTVEKFYSHGIFPGISRLMDFLFDGIPFCCCQFIILLFMFFLCVRTVFLIRKSIPGSGPVQFIKSAVKGIFLWGGTVYFLFMILWGFSYHRLPVSIKFPPAENTTAEELASCTESLVQRIKTSAVKTTRKEDGTFQADVTFLKEKFHGKPFLFSKLMSFAGISGFYCPFTGEAVYNDLMPDVYLPFTMAHEYAHKSGRGPEDETNFAAYLVCISSDSPDLRYSGELAAFRYLIGRLADADPAAAEKLYAELPDSAKTDLAAGRNFWQAHRGKIRLVSGKINDRFLKANGQHTGINSYEKITGFIIALEKTGFYKRNSAEAESLYKSIFEYK